MANNGISSKVVLQTSKPGDVLDNSLEIGSLSISWLHDGLDLLVLAILVVDDGSDKSQESEVSGGRVLSGSELSAVGEALVQWLDEFVENGVGGLGDDIILGFGVEECLHGAISLDVVVEQGVEVGLLVLLLGALGDESILPGDPLEDWHTLVDH